MKLGFKRGEKGFTLVELMVVMAILAVLSAIVFPAVTGTTTTSRQTRQPMDTNNIQTGVDRFNADDAQSDWPTDGPVDGSTWSAGELPTGSKSGSGTSSDRYIFSEDDIAAIDWSATATAADGATNDLYPDFVRNQPSYSDVTSANVTLAASASANFTVVKGGATLYLTITNGASGEEVFDIWNLDEDGGVWVFKDADSY